MQNLIMDGGSIQGAFEAGNDSEVLSLLNAATEKVTTEFPDQEPGFSSIATMGKNLGESALATFLSVLSGAIAYNRSLDTLEGNGKAELIEGFKSRFSNSQHGIDMANEAMRTQVTVLLNAASVDPAPYLELGHKLFSKAKLKYGRDAIQADIDAVRAEQTLTAKLGAVGDAHADAVAAVKADPSMGLSAVQSVFDTSLAERWGD